MIPISVFSFILPKLAAGISVSFRVELVVTMHLRQHHKRCDLTTQLVNSANRACNITRQRRLSCCCVLSFVVHCSSTCHRRIFVNRVNESILRLLSHVVQKGFKIIPKRTWLCLTSESAALQGFCESRTCNGPCFFGVCGRLRR